MIDLTNERRIGLHEAAKAAVQNNNTTQSTLLCNAVVARTPMIPGLACCVNALFATLKWKSYFGPAPKLPPSFRQGKPTHISTILRWITRGIRPLNGEIVRLEGARLGGRWTTTVEAVERFMDRLTVGALGDVANPDVPAPRTSRQRQRQLDRVNRKLDKAGL
jgi:hypothetical protein